MKKNSEDTLPIVLNIQNNTDKLLEDVILFGAYDDFKSPDYTITSGVANATYDFIQKFIACEGLTVKQIRQICTLDESQFDYPWYYEEKNIQGQCIQSPIEIEVDPWQYQLMIRDTNVEFDIDGKSNFKLKLLPKEHLTIYLFDKAGKFNNFYQDLISKRLVQYYKPTSAEETNETFVIQKEALNKLKDINYVFPEMQCDICGIPLSDKEKNDIGVYDTFKACHEHRDEVALTIPTEQFQRAWFLFKEQNSFRNEGIFRLWCNSEVGIAARKKIRQEIKQKEANAPTEPA